MAKFDELFLKKWPGELIRVVRTRSESQKPKYQGSLDHFVLIYLERAPGSRDTTLLVWSQRPEYSKDGKSIVDLYWTSSPVNVKDYAKEKLGRKYKDLIKTDTALQLELIQQFIKNDGYLKGHTIIQDPLDMENIPPQEIKAKQDPPPETKKDETTGNSKKEEKEVIPTQAVKTVPLKASDVVGDLVLTKVSGPGELIGVTTLKIDMLGFEYGSLFSGIQFSDPGEYVVGVNCTSPDVVGSTFSVTVLPEPEVVPQDESRGQETIKDGTRPMITQIDQPTLKLSPIVLPLDTAKGAIEWSADSMGMMPFISFANNPIQDRDISQFKLYHAGMIPKCQLTFVDSQNFMRNVGQPKDDTTFDVFIHARSNSLKSIHLSFVVEKFKQVSAGQYSVIGSLHIPGGQVLYQTKYGNFEGTSFEAMRDISKQMGIGYNSNIDNTADKMNWIYGGKKTWETMDEIIKNSYINDKSFMAGYIDFYYCFNYVDIQKEMERDITGDVGVETGTDKGSSLDKIVAQRLINETSMNKSCFYFAADPATKQLNTAKNLKKGYRTVVKYYDRKQKKFCVFKIESNTSDGKTSYILKAAPNDKKSFKKNETHIDLGEIDLDNVHTNYLYASELNRRNLDELSNLEMTLVMPNANLNLYKYQKVHITLVNTAETVTDAERIKWSHTGEWIIMDISYNFTTEGTAKKFTQEVRVVRKELGKSPEEIKKDGKQEQKTVEEPKKEENPIPVAPNTGFNIGDVFRLRDKDGREWLLRVNIQDFDGTTIQAYIASAEVSPVKSELQSENKQPIDQQTEQTATNQAKDSTEKKDLPPKTQDFKEASIALVNDKTGTTTDYKGTVTMEKQGPRKRAVGTMALPNKPPVTIIGDWIYKYNGVFNQTDDELLSEMLIRLENNDDIRSLDVFVQGARIKVLEKKQ